MITHNGGVTYRFGEIPVAIATHKVLIVANCKSLGVMLIGLYCEDLIVEF